MLLLERPDEFGQCAVGALEQELADQLHSRVVENRIRAVFLLGRRDIARLAAAGDQTVDGGYADPESVGEFLPGSLLIDPRRKDAAPEVERERSGHTRIRSRGIPLGKARALKLRGPRCQ